MTQKSRFICLLVLATGLSFVIGACGGGGGNPTLPTGSEPGFSVSAVAVGSQSEVVQGPPGAYYISEDRLRFHLRCPCGRCTKFNALPLEPSPGSNVWRLSGAPGRPTLSPSIHWFETDGVTTHWHGWLRDGVFTN